MKIRPLHSHTHHPHIMCAWMFQCPSVSQFQNRWCFKLPKKKFSRKTGQSGFQAQWHIRWWGEIFRNNKKEEKKLVFQWPDVSFSSWQLAVNCLTMRTGTRKGAIAVCLCVCVCLFWSRSLRLTHSNWILVTAMAKSLLFIRLLCSLCASSFWR